MEPYVEQRLIQLLRDSTSPALPLRDLHRALEAESVDGAGSRAFLEESLRKRSNVFIVLEAANPLGNPDAWPACARSEYEQALEAAGLETGPHVSLADDAPLDDPLDESARGRPCGVLASLRELRASLLRVLHASGDNTGLRDAIAAALAASRDLPAALADQLDAGGSDGHEASAPPAGLMVFRLEPERR